MDTDPDSASEYTPLLVGGGANGSLHGDERSSSRRVAIFDFLEAKTPAGRRYESLIILLIVANVLAFIIGSLFVEEYNHASWAKRESGICQNLCDSLFFGNYEDNGLQGLHLGTTSILEIVTVAIFTVEYVLRLKTCDLEDPKYKGFVGRLRYIPSFFSLVDLASTLPFYVDALLPKTNVAGSAFLRMFRLLRMMRVEGRYDTALTMVDDVYAAQKEILGTAVFIGATTWISVSSLYYIVERKSLDMVYCGAAPSYCPEDVDTSLCKIDSWGIVDCSKADCPPSDEYPEPCYNLFQSIPMASFYALLNLFGEFPLVDQHSVGGMVVGTFTAIVAVAVFALPASIVASGFEDEIAKHVGDDQSSVPPERDLLTVGFVADPNNLRGRCYNFFHAQTMPGSKVFEYVVNALIIGTGVTFLVDTLDVASPGVDLAMDIFELLAVILFTVEYGAKTYSCPEDPKFAAGTTGLLIYLTSFVPMVDILSVLPYWVEVIAVGTIAVQSNLVKALRLLRILRFEKYTNAFSSFDDIIWRNKDVLAVTAFTAVLLWVFFGAFLYLTERDNPDEEMASNYNTVPNAMWITLLNLAGEAPLAQYSTAGKVAVGILGVFATAVFGIPIGLIVISLVPCQCSVLGAGFEELLEEETEDNPEELERDSERRNEAASTSASTFEEKCYMLTEGLGSSAARVFETSIFILIFTGVAIGVLQTVPGHENDLNEIEVFTVVMFTVEYLIRLVGAGANPEFAGGGGGPVRARIRYIFSFYSAIDLLSFVPFYLSLALPGSIIDQYDEYLRMFRILRLLKLDKYVPSISLIDDVIRLKFDALRVALFASLSLWILFAALLYVFEHNDTSDDIDPVPSYGCTEYCTMADRFQNFFDSMTGDYPITDYTWPSRFVNFFMVIAAVGVVSIPSALIASGFVEIVQSKIKAKEASHGGESNEPIPVRNGVAGDDWYEIAYRELENADPPASKWGPKVDKWQNDVNEFLNGKRDENGKIHFTTYSSASRTFIFSVIIANIIAVFLESVPMIDKKVGNQRVQSLTFDNANVPNILGCVLFGYDLHKAEYIARLFCAPKNREALYSSWVYARTFFGIVDFLSTAPWFVEQALLAFGVIEQGDGAAMLEDFFVAFSKLDNVFRASKDILKATGLLALIIWVGCGALFFIFEENNPNWRQCDDSVPITSNGTIPGCYDFNSTAECNEFYPGQCDQKVFTSMPNTLYLTAVFLGGEWGVVDFTWPGRLVCLFLCVCGIGLYAIPIGALFDSFGAILGMTESDADEEGDAEE
eukprot:scaffold1442_cov128-Cylindrotheca_fusiformis.AAC.47